jgi:rhodanese-related sulfurtransferase
LRFPVLSENDDLSYIIFGKPLRETGGSAGDSLRQQDNWTIMPGMRFLLVMAVLLVAGASRAAVVAGSAPAQASPARSDTLPVARMSIPLATLSATRGEALFVDVRPAGQRALGHIRGDVHIPFERLAARQSELPRDRRLVFYCSCPAEELALDAARILLQAGDSLVAVLVGGYDGWRAAGGSIQVDATWEDIFRVDESPVGWGKTPVDTMRCRYARDDSVAAHGRAGARITCVPAATSRGFAGYTQRLDAEGLRGRQVTLSAMVRSEGIERSAFLWIGAEDPQGRVMGMTRPDADPIVGTQVWRRIEVSGAVPANAVRVLIGVSLTASGRLWLDDVRLVATEEGGRPLVRVVVRNPGFEE